MRRTARRIVVPVAIASLGLFGLAACGDDSDDADENSTSEETTDADGDDEAAPEDATTTVEPVGGNAAAWAHPISTDGELIGTAEVGDLMIEIYEVAIDQATRSSIWADPDTDEPIVAEGDDVVVLNYVVTNHGEPVNLGISLVDISLRYDDWPYAQQPTVADNTLLDSYGLSGDGYSSDARGEDVYVLGAGEQYAISEVILHQPGESFTVRVQLDERDDAGERTGDRLEGDYSGSF